MKNARIFGTIIVLIACMGILSAQTAVLGKIYNSDSSDVVVNAQITVNCGTDVLDTDTDNSKNDGAYAVIFGGTECNNISDAVSVTVTGSNTGTNNGVLNLGTGSIDYFTIINVLTSVTPTTPPSTLGGNSYGGRSNRYFNCGNGVCDTGETIDTCAEDCDTTYQSLNADLNDELEFSEIGTTPETETQPEPTQNFFSRMTGAFLGASGRTQGLITIIFILGLAGAFISVRTIRKGKLVAPQ